jgi:hypothetical protein
VSGAASISGINLTRGDGGAAPSLGAAALSGTSTVAPPSPVFRARVRTGRPSVFWCWRSWIGSTIPVRLGRMRPVLARGASDVVSLLGDERGGDFSAAKRFREGSTLNPCWVSLSRATTFLVRSWTEDFLARLISTVNDGTVRWRTLYSQSVTRGRENLDCPLARLSSPCTIPQIKPTLI